MFVSQSVWKKLKRFLDVIHLDIFFLKKSVINNQLSFCSEEPSGLGKEAKSFSRYLTVCWLFNQLGLEP